MASKQIRPIRVEGNIAYVPLTQGYEAIIDAVDVPLVREWNWYAVVNAKYVYAVRHSEADRKRHLIRLHRQITAAPEGLEVDHRDGDGLNNRRENLRIATRSQNQQNRPIQANNTSGFKGVFWEKSAGRWRSQISLAGKQLHLGLFDKPEDAAAAYAKASGNLHGEYGRLK